MQLTIYDYIAARKPSDAVALIKSYGYTPNSNTVRCISDCLAKLSTEGGTDFLDQLASIHPDKDLILSVETAHSFDGDSGVMSQAPVTAPAKSCGCANKCSGSGCNQSQQHNLSSAVLVVGLLLAAAIISKI